MPRLQKKTVDPDKQLMIKTKACQRLIKENAYYEKELIENEDKLCTMQNEGADPYDIKKFAEIVDESRMMIPDSKVRLDRSLEDLRQYVQSDEVMDGADKNGEWYKASLALLEERGVRVGGGAKDTEVEGGVKEGCDGGGGVPLTNVEDMAEGEAF